MPSYLAWHIVCPSSGRLPSHPVGHLVALDSSMCRDPADPNVVVGHDSSGYLDGGPCPISGCQSGCPVPLPPAAAAFSRRGLNPASAVLPSTIELFHLYRQMLAQGAKLSSGAPLLDPARTFAKHLDDYADSVLSARLDRVGRPAAGPPPPRPPQSQRPRVLPFASLPNPLPQGPDLRNPSPTLSEQMMARLPLPSVAPPELVHIQTWAGHPVVKEGPDRRVACEQLVIPLGRGLADPP